MDKEEKLRMLQNLNEETLTKKVLIPLFSKGRGCKNVRYNHGSLEFGKDIIYYTEDEFDIRKYIGVQVKAKEITTSDTDMILRQITGAFGKPFTDLGDGKQKDLSRMVLITSHEFTEEAKEYLWGSLETYNLHRDVTFMDGNDLVDLLDKYLPSAFWEEYDYFSKYFHAMKKEFETIKDISAIGQKEAIPLEKIYVSLKLSEERGEILREETDKEIDRERWVIEEKRKREQILDADAVAEEFDKVVIVGDTGSGKTTLLKHLALKFCKENLKTQERIAVPVLIPLKQFSESGKNLTEYAEEIFEHFDFPKAKDFIEKDLKDGKCVLLFDGFDELATLEKQQTVAKKIEEFISTYYKNQFIVTSRVAGYHDELKGFEKLKVMEFDDRQIEQFITNWFGKTNPEKAAAMSKTVRENERIRAIARSPLMIAIIAIIYEEDRDLPQRRVELYQRCVEVLLSKWDVQRRIKNKYDAKAKEKILRKLALEAHSSERKTFTREELLKMFSAYLPEVNIKKEKAEDVLNEIVQRNVLLKEVSIGVYEFLHLSFQEYLAALELRERRDYDTLLTHLYESWWEEVILLFAGFDRDATELLQKIKEREREDKRFKEDDSYRNLTLMGKCIVDADYTSIQLRNQIANDLWSLYQTAEISPCEKAMRIISFIKPDNIIDLLIKNLKDENNDVRKRAAVALGEIGSEKAVTHLIEAFTTNKNNKVLRSVTYALGEIGSEKAVPPLIEALKDEDSEARRRAAYILGEIGSEKAVTHLIEALQDEDSDVRERAAIALGLIGSKKAVPPLIEALTDEDNIVQWWAAEALGKVGSEKAVDPLKNALKDEGIHGKVKDMAFDSLEKIIKSLKSA